MERLLDHLLQDVVRDGRGPVVIISGGAAGADTLGELYAVKRGCTVSRYPARWDKYGKAAGHIRNRAMAEDAHAVVCFWDGVSRGTANMIETCKLLGKPLRIDAPHIPTRPL